MSYWALNLLFLAAVGLLAASALVARRGPAWRAVGVVLVVVLVLTAVFDNVMILAGLVGYDSELISGVFLGVAPVEDFAYAVAAVVLLPTLWTLLGGDETADS